MPNLKSAMDRPTFSKAALPCAVLLAAGIAFSPALYGEFLNWDDDRIAQNSPITSSLTAANLVSAFSRIHFESYQPLHLVSYMIDASFWPKNPLGYRAHNLVLYLLGISALFALWLRIGFSPAAAAAATAFFSLCPLRVESAAWITGRKDLLMLCFGLLSWHAYLSVDGATPKKKAAFYALSLLAFLAALLSKSMAVTFVPAMAAVELGLMRRGFRRTALGLTPHAILAIGTSAAVTLLWKHASLIPAPPIAGPFGAFKLIGWTVLHYLRSTAWPFSLSPIYAEPSAETINRAFPAACAAACAVVATIVWAHKKSANPLRTLVPVIWFFATLAPFANIVPLYYWAADRYLLVASIGTACAVGMATDAVRMQKSRPLQRAFAVLFALVLAAYAAASFMECRAWQTSESLWTQATARQPNSFFAQMKAGETFRKNGQSAKASVHYRKARLLRPLSPLALGGLFWSNLLEDRCKAFSTGEDEKWTAVFVANANNRGKLISFADFLARQGCYRAAEVVRERLIAVPTAL